EVRQRLVGLAELVGDQPEPVVDAALRRRLVARLSLEEQPQQRLGLSVAALRDRELGERRGGLDVTWRGGGCLAIRRRGAPLLARRFAQEIAELRQERGALAWLGGLLRLLPEQPGDLVV